MNPYDIVGLPSNTPLDDITVEFNKKKSELMNKVLAEGEAGTKAAIKLQKLKEAYEEILYLKKAQVEIRDDNNVRPLGRIEELIKQGDLVEAQSLLDAQIQRGAEWHYVQAALYYKQGWIMESKKQLELAQKLSPHEEKYIKAYKHLMNVVVFGHPDGADVNEEDSPTRSYSDNSNASNKDIGCCSICGAIMCVDCCCDNNDRSQ